MANGTIKVSITNNTDSVIYARSYSNQPTKNNVTFGSDPGVSTRVKLSGSTFLTKLEQGETVEKTFPVVHDVTYVMPSVGLFGAICISELPELPTEVYAYFKRDEFNNVTQHVDYTSLSTYSISYAVAGKYYSSFTKAEAEKTNLVSSATVNMVYVGDATRVVNATNWWMNAIPASANLITNNPLVSLIFFVILVSACFKLIFPKLFSMIEDSDEKKRRRHRREKNLEDE